jgi:hypothetical protein
MWKFQNLKLTWWILNFKINKLFDTCMLNSPKYYNNNLGGIYEHDLILGWYGIWYNCWYDYWY